MSSSTHLLFEDGSGTNFIYGNGSHDRLTGGSGGNFIEPDGSGLASIEVKDSNNQPSFDGNIDSTGNAYQHDDRAFDAGNGSGGSGYFGRVGYNWTFDNFDSGVRLGGGATSTPVAVYVTWDPTGLSEQFSADAHYAVYDESTPLRFSSGLDYKEVNQQIACGATDSPEGGDRPWLLLGVWNIPLGDTLSVHLSDGESTSGDYLCIGDAMIHAIWPTVSIRADLDGKGTFTEKDDFLAACNPVDIPVEGDSARAELKLSASIESLYYSIATSTPDDWNAVLPNVAGLLFWNTADSGTSIQPDGDGNILNIPMSSDGFDQTVWFSAPPDTPDPEIKLTVANKPIQAQAEGHRASAY